MKVKATFTFSAVLSVPDALVDKSQVGTPAIVAEIADQLKAEMGLKYGKDVSVAIEVLEG
jgi:hypothetical protein